MVTQSRNIITESERNRIKSLYGLKIEKDFVFDFVLTENNKYLIIMDQVFVEGGNGKSIGSIWENTYIFNEILKETLGPINESVDKFIENVKWEKEQISEWLKEKTIISEDWLQDLKSGASNLVSKIGNAAVETTKTIFNKGIVPALRWIRRGLYTGVGIVIDVVVSILAAKTNAIVWFVVVLLDIYEIATGDFDPQDPERMKLPFFFLFTDLLGCIFTGAIAFGAKKAIPAITKQGLEKGAPHLVGPVKTLNKKIPTLQNQLMNVATNMGKNLGPKSSGVITKIKSFIGNILNRLSEFLSKLFSKQGLKAGAIGGAVYAGSHVVGTGVSSIDKEGKVGKSVTAFDEKIRKITGKGGLNVSKEEGDAILSTLGLNQL
jgi:hypothetical protein